MAVTVYRRRLPHIRIKGATYFVTWRVHTDQPVLCEDERDDIAAAIRHFDNARYILHAYVVMDDHVHVLVRTLPEWRLEEIIQSWKSFTANRMQRNYGRTGSVWQDEYFDRVVRDQKEYERQLDYILHNPNKRWPSLVSYRWAWATGVDA
jgi:REP element-mobilizing transposase RayT